MNSTLMLVTLPTLNGKPIIQRETEKALLVEVEDNNAVWMPKSQVKGFWSTERGVWMVTTPFMVKEKGLSYRSQKATEGDIYAALNAGTGAWI
jgi:hypothetical protein